MIPRVNLSWFEIIVLGLITQFILAVVVGKVLFPKSED